MSKLAQWLLEMYPDWKPGDGEYHQPQKPTPERQKSRHNNHWDFDQQSIYLGANKQPILDERGFNHGYRHKPKVAKGRDEFGE